MDTTVFPTKGNLIYTINTLQLSHQGYELLDRKRNILIGEMMHLIDEAQRIQSQIDKIFNEAYKALETANITLGISVVEQIGHAIPLEEKVEIRFRSIMGVDIPIVNLVYEEHVPRYGLFRTNVAFDDTYHKFHKVKQLTVQLAETENAVYRLADHIKRTQKRANALKNIMIPRLEQTVSFIQGALEEKEREEFTRLKVVKHRKSSM